MIKIIHDPVRCRGITLLSRVMKLQERFLDQRIREWVEQEIGEEQQTFRKGRGVMDGMFTLRESWWRRGWRCKVK